MIRAYLALGLVIAWVISLAVAFEKGDRSARNAMLAADWQNQINTTRKFNEYTAEDLDATRKAAEAQARASIKAQGIQHQLEMEALHGNILVREPGPTGTIHVGATSIGLLNDAIAGYNANAVAPDISPGKVPPDAKPRPEPRQGGGSATAYAPGDIRIRLSMLGDARRNGGLDPAPDQALVH